MDEYVGKCEMCRDYTAPFYPLLFTQDQSNTRPELQNTNPSSVSAGLPRDHPESYHSYMWNNFFKHVDIEPQNTHVLDGNASDLQKECDAFEQKITAAGGIELFMGGAFNTSHPKSTGPSDTR